MLVELLSDDEIFGIKAGEIFEAKIYPLDPSKITLLKRVSDGYNPECNQYSSQVKIVPPDYKGMLAKTGFFKENCMPTIPEAMGILDRWNFEVTTRYKPNNSGGGKSYISLGCFDIVDFEDFKVEWEEIADLGWVSGNENKYLAALLALIEFDQEGCEKHLKADEPQKEET